MLAGTLTTTVAGSVLVLLYVDLRMRREGLDWALRAAADASGQFASAERSAERFEDGAV